MLLDDEEIMTYGDSRYTQVHHSPDGLKVLILDGDKTMQVFYLHDTGELAENSQTIPLESKDVSIGWF